MTKGIHVRDIPEDVLLVHQKRAAAQGQSFQGYLRQLLIDSAATLTPAELAQQSRHLATRSKVKVSDITDPRGQA